MARTIQEIQNEIFESIKANKNLEALNSTSKVAVYRLLVFVVSFSIWTLETLFDIHRKELMDKLANQKAGTLAWYRTMALAFQYGFDLKTDSDKFDNKNATEDQIKASKIIKYAAVVEGSQRDIVIKIAGEDQGVLAPIKKERKEVFVAYIEEIRFAGVKTTIINYAPDKLILEMEIYCDPLVIDGEGNSILNGGKPVNVAIQEYMEELPFNGELVLAHLVDKLQQVEGVLIPHIVKADSCWIDATTTTKDYGLPQPIIVKKIPESGYFTIEKFDKITYKFDKITYVE